jgi:CPA2 family monovalent cation:H+ antiporter-2
VLLGKPLVAFLIVWAMRYPMRAAITVAIALAQIGEFSFILATLGRELGVLTAEATNALVATSIASIVLNPLLYQAIDPVTRWVAAKPRLSRVMNRGPSTPIESDSAREEPSLSPSHRAVVIGYGPTGRTVVGLLRDNRVEPTVIELNMETVRLLRAEGIDAIYGDATRPEALVAAGVSGAGSLILGAAGMAGSAEVIRTARSLNPEVRVLARAAYLRDVRALKEAGADTVYSGEAEVALAFIEDILETLGATPEQIDRARAQAHHELSTGA